MEFGIDLAQAGTAGKIPHSQKGLCHSAIGSLGGTCSNRNRNYHPSGKRFKVGSHCVSPEKLFASHNYPTVIRGAIGVPVGKTKSYLLVIIDFSEKK